MRKFGRRTFLLWALLVWSAFFQPASVSAFPGVEALRGEFGAHDPSTLVKHNSRFYLFSTGRGISSRWSPDLITWNVGPAVFANPPAWVTNAAPGFNGDFWAPDLIAHNGQYFLYYSVSSWGSPESAIGLATNPTLDPSEPTYLWTDQGIVIQSDWSKNYNTIDPSVFRDSNGTLWLAFGSYWSGIKLIQLDPATGKRITPNSSIYSLAWNSSIEAACLTRRGSYYYLFVNWNQCCAGVDSKYLVRVGRSTSITGPYLDRNGQNLLDARGEVFMESSGRYIGPGHIGLLSESGTNWFSFHYYDGANNGAARLGLARLSWTTDGWPVFTNDWSAFYAFEFGAREDTAQFHGALNSGATIVADPGRGRVLQLSGINQFVRLPLAVANASSFAAWVKWNGGGDWQRIFDFGTGTGAYLMLTPRASNGKLRFSTTISGPGAPEQMIDGPTALPIGAWTHVAVTLNGQRGLLYVNGAPVGTNNTLTIRPWQTMARSNYVGKSQFAADPAYSGQIDSLRIYGRVLSDAEVAMLARVHPSLAHRWSFNADATDNIGTAHGELRGGSTITNGAVALDGVTGHVNLPNNLIAANDSLTVETWVTDTGSGPWARIFDFGNSTGGEDFAIGSATSGTGYSFLSSPSDFGSLRGAYTISGGGAGEQLLEQFGAPLPTNELKHVAWVTDGPSHIGRLYVDSVQVAVNSNMTLTPFLIGATVNNWLGRSQWNDPLFKGSISEFRIYAAALSPEEVATSRDFGPERLAIPVRLSLSNAPGGQVFSWPSYAVGFNLESSSTLINGALWSPVPGSPALNQGSRQLSVPTLGNANYYRLKQQ